ncbi:MAG: hypothetical protein LBI69_05230, partial [Puniceicoccales bacterium]|nr:hypothetical protein [Puniceicoccales bacterium]
MNSISNYSTVESVSGNVNLGYAAIGKMEANLQNLCNAGPTDSEVLVESSAEKWKIFMEGKIRKYHERNALNRANFAYASRCRRIAGRLNGADPLAIAKFLCGQNLKNLVEMANVIGEMNPEKAAKALSLIEDVEIRICIIFGMDPVKAANILNQMEESQVNGLLWRIFAPCMNAIRPEIAAIMGAMDPEKLKTLVADAARKCLSEGNCRSRWQPHFTFAEHLLRMPPLAVVRIFNSLNWTEHGEKDAMAAAVLLSKGLILEEGNSRIGAIFYHINNPKMEEKIIANLEKIHARDICWGSNVNDESYKNSNAKQVWLEGEKRIFEAKGLWAAASYINSDVRSGRVALEIIQMEDCDKAVKTIEHMALDPAAAAAVLEDYSTFEES